MTEKSAIHLSRFHPGSDFLLEIAKGTIPDHAGVNKFGRAPSGVQTTATDFWDRANATPTQQLWTAPTQARLHNIVSSSTSDDGDPAGVGARTLRVYGLTDWSLKEVSEDIILNGTTNVSTVNSYVIIHRMQVLTKGATNVNVGIITATAATDGTVTAQINASEGQTQMAVYGLSSKCTAYMGNYYASVNKASGAVAEITARILVNPEPESELTNFLVKHLIGVQSTGNSHFSHPFKPYLKIVGPAIIKLNGLGSAADIDATGGFDLILVDN